MGVTEKTAILVISFGTSYEETRKKTIEQIESDLHHAFPEYPLYCAWTSPRIRAKLRKRDGIHIMDIDEAMTQLKADGIRNVVVQPTYVITGFESDAMKEKVLAHKKDFDSVIICDSLMVTKQDKEEVCQAMAQEYHPDSDEILLFMGHGTEHVANELYPEMDELFKHFGYSNMHMGTVEGDFSIESFLDKLKNLHPAHVHLAPFMIVAGDHATNDMSGEARSRRSEIFLSGIPEPDWTDFQKSRLKHSRKSRVYSNQKVSVHNNTLRGILPVNKNIKRSIPH